MPYKSPFLLVDGVIYLKKHIFIKSFKKIKKNDFFLRRHFINNYAYPGVLMLEIFHQTSLILLYESKKFNYKNKMFYLAKINFAKFFFPVSYKDCIICNVTMFRKVLNSYIFHGKIIVNKKVACLSSFICILK
ncbi:hypothetical protein [Buchnera aphidicola]|uniref:hypothetical protein n=1 Tax=Buchnera aphidicola TaxID=9 RepID=UPI0031B8682C